MGYSGRDPGQNEDIALSRMSLNDTRLYNLQDDPREKLDVKNKHPYVLNW